MRDLNRIKPFLNEIEKIWLKVPDWRFGQLICNIPFDKDPFFMEEDEFLDCLKKLFAPIENNENDIEKEAMEVCGIRMDYDDCIK